jgi:hypothetical protein
LLQLFACGRKLVLQDSNLALVHTFDIDVESQRVVDRPAKEGKDADDGDEAEHNEQKETKADASSKATEEATSAAEPEIQYPRLPEGNISSIAVCPQSLSVSRVALPAVVLT